MVIGKGMKQRMSIATATKNNIFRIESSSDSSFNGGG